MIKYLPDPQDGIDYYSFTPMLATLYGRNEPPYRFLRVVSTSAMSGRSSLSMFGDVIGTGENEQIIIESVDIESFLTYISYGYTPYIECLMSGYSDAIDLREYQRYFISQAALRNYESRATTLMELCDRKKYSLAGMFTSNAITGELVDELSGALVLWEMLMNMGTLNSRDCLTHIKETDGPLIPFKRLNSKMEELGDRLLHSNHANLQYKVSQEMRTKLLRAYAS